MRELCVITALVAICAVAMNYANNGVSAARQREVEILIDEPIPDNIPARNAKMEELKNLNFRELDNFRPN